MMASEEILFKNVQVIDGNRDKAFPADVLVQNGEISTVKEGGGLKVSSGRTIEGRGRTLMSGLCDAHTHLSWNSTGDLSKIASMELEEHMLVCVETARIMIDQGYTMAVGAASAKQRLDIVIRDAINTGQFPGPRYLANAQELATPAGVLFPGATNVVSGVEEVRRKVRELCGMGVDLVKVIQSGESVTERVWAKDDYFTDEEIAVIVEESHRVGRRVATHARSAESCAKAVRHGIDILYHMTYIDDATMDLLEQRKDSVFVAPGLHWLIATCEEAHVFGYERSRAELVGYVEELEVSIEGMKEMHRRGIKVLPGGDYGFAWTPHGTNARDLQHFVERLDFTPMEAIRAATVYGGEIMQDAKLGNVLPGFHADLLLVDGDPLSDIAILQDKSKLVGIMKSGEFHKDPDVSDFIAGL
tara:strand:- start:386 stop:1633 length:1248 start_codon:yes stop_codon:yes gene_type:complete